MDIVNPIPPRTLAPYKCLFVTLDGSLALFNYTKVYETPNIPTCLPITSPNIIPKLTGLYISVEILLTSIAIPEFAIANICITTKEDHGDKVSSILYKIDVSNSPTVFPTGNAIPSNTPAIVACIPDFKTQIHSDIPKITYTDVNLSSFICGILNIINKSPYKKSTKYNF
jgi:hypothetical protein